MCTGVSYTTRDHYFGRNLDLEFSYHEEVVVTPRNFPFRFRRVDPLETHHAIIGIATIGVLGRFETVDEVEAALADVTIIDVSFSEAFPASPLHWIIADRSRSITVESVREGLRVSPELPPDRYSRGIGAIALPGDLSSSSRFVRAAVTRVDMHREDLDADALVHYPLVTGQQINMQN